MDTNTNKAGWPVGTKTLALSGPAVCQASGDTISVSLMLPNTPDNWSALRMFGEMRSIAMPSPLAAETGAQPPTATRRGASKTGSVADTLVPSTGRRQGQGKGGRRNGATSARDTAKTDQPAEAAAA